MIQKVVGRKKVIHLCRNKTQSLTPKRSKLRPRDDLEKRDGNFVSPPKHNTTSQINNRKRFLLSQASQSVPPQQAVNMSTGGNTSRCQHNNNSSSPTCTVAHIPISASGDVIARTQGEQLRCQTTEYGCQEAHQRRAM